MPLAMRGPVSIKLLGSLRHKKLLGEWGELFAGEGGNPPRIELYTCRGKSSATIHIIVLEQLKFCDRSFQEEKPFFSLSIRKTKYQLKFDSVDKKNDWVNSLCQVSSELWAQRASLLQQSSDLKGRGGEEEMKNDGHLYDTCNEGQQFKVSVYPNRTSEANDLRGDYILNFTEHDVQLLEVDTLKSMHDWSYKHIRKFAHTRQTFSIEVGRKCSTGEGEFVFLTPEVMQLVKQVHISMKQARENMNRRGKEQQGEGQSVPKRLNHESEAPCSPAPLPQRKSAESGTADLLIPSHTNAATEKETDSLDSDIAGNPERKATAKLKKKQEEEKEKNLKGSKSQGSGAEPAASKGNRYELGYVRDGNYRDYTNLLSPSGSDSGDDEYLTPSNLPGLDLGDADQICLPSLSRLHFDGCPVAPQRLQPVGDSQLYSLPENPLKDAWKTRGRLEEEHIHTENYQSLQEAFDS